MNDLKKAADFILSGEIVAFPTETVYGFGADLLNEKALEKLFSLKQRSKDKSFIAHVSSILEVEGLAEEIPDSFYLLAKRFWPGPLTVILKKRGGGTIAVRSPNHPLAVKLIEAVGRPIAGTSANMSGSSPLLSADEVKALFGAKVAYILDGGVSTFKIPSTIISLVDKPKILRSGAIDEKILLS